MTNKQKEIVRKGYDKLSYTYRNDNAIDDEGFYTEWVNCLKEKIPAPTKESLAKGLATIKSSIQKNYAGCKNLKTREIHHGREAGN